ncbi:hypothetical protein NDQ53_14430 [Rossellomorea marisflavi]|uniref:hypothetical protein n=1 Tax=Rossellomorea marisflavi TaxID=189381 RepID=UPI00204268C5|nr:hypothetical protein [Rossellomorea marisflavi]MCM2590496.1 hypothetical protein [Rossellomorea marisflavi]
MDELMSKSGVLLKSGVMEMTSIPYHLYRLIEKKKALEKMLNNERKNIKILEELLAEVNYELSKLCE